MIQKNKKIITVVLLAAILLTLCFIFSNSMDSKEVSGQKSAVVKEVVDAVAEALGSEELVTEHILRKMAHFLEFFALGMELTAMCMLWKQSLVWAAFLGHLAAHADETIQIFSKRGPSVADVWLDFSGVLAGLCIVWCIAKAAKHFGHDKMEKSIVKKV